jgi:hypothetical protein
MIMGCGSMFSRRWLLRAAALGSCIPAYGKREQPLGVQIYTVREIVVQRPREILSSIAEIGYREVEMLRSQITPVAPYLKRVGLRPVSVHFETPLITGNWRAWKEDDMPTVSESYTFEEAIAETKQHGFESNKGEITRGIYEIIDETNKRACWGRPGGPRPTDFTSTPGSGRTVQYWRLISKELGE